MLQVASPHSSDPTKKMKCSLCSAPWLSLISVITFCNVTAREYKVPAIYVKSPEENVWGLN